MANDANLQDMRARALNLADMTGSGFAVVTMVTADINSALAELHEEIINANEDYIVSKQNITVVAGTEEYPLPSDYMKTIKMFWVGSGGARYTINRYTHVDADGDEPPSVSGSVRHYYAPQLTKLSGDEDTVSVALPIGWDDFAVYHAAAQLKIREEADPQGVLLERERVKQRIINMVRPRDMGEPEQIEDHYGRWSGRRRQDDTSNLKYRLIGENISLLEGAR